MTLLGKGHYCNLSWLTISRLNCSHDSQKNPNWSSKRIKFSSRASQRSAPHPLAVPQLPFLAFLNHCIEEFQRQIWRTGESTFSSFNLYFSKQHQNTTVCFLTPTRMHLESILTLRKTLQNIVTVILVHVAQEFHINKGVFKLCHIVYKCWCAPKFSACNLDCPYRSYYI